MRFLLRMIPANNDVPSTARLLRTVASSIGGRAVNLKRTTYGALEMDVFVESRADFDLFLAATEPLGKTEFYKDLQAAPVHLSVKASVREAASLFNAERYWEAHEVLEAKWRVSQGPEKALLQGLILTCAAFVHVQKDEPRVALGVARRAIPLLTWQDADYHGVDVHALRSSLEKMVDDGRLTALEL